MTTLSSAPAASRRPAPPVQSETTSKRPSRHVAFRVFTYLGAIVLAFVVLVWAEGLLVRLPRDPVGSVAPGERIGVVHVHTKASDGSGTIPEVVTAAHDARLSFIVITDHNVAMNTASQQASGTNGPADITMISGEELSTASGHFLALGIPPGWRRPGPANSDALLAATREAGAFNVIAHPFHNNIPWTNWKTSDFEGMEIWNEDEVWRRDRGIDVLNAVLVWPVNPQLALTRLARRPGANFAKWDELLAQRPIAGMCGADAHAAIRLWRGAVLPFPAYRSVFLAAREHVLLGPDAGGSDARRAGSAEILNALRRGHSFCALDALYPAGGFTALLSSGGATAGPGESLAWSTTGDIHVAVPSGSPKPLIKVIRNGKEIASRESWTLDEPIGGPGRYRTEIYLRQPGFLGGRRWALWIFSNPTYVTASAAGKSGPASPKQ